MLIKIGDITSQFGVSHRSLHYWESVGIIKSSRAENDYRYYDEENQQKIKQILILRKLRLPLKQIIMVLESDNTVEIIDTLQQNLNEVDDEITALSTIRSILDSFITKLNENMMIDIKVNLLDDSTILEISDSLTVSRPALKEEKTSEDLVKADAKLSKLTDRNVRIVYLPPATVASIHIIGFNPENESDKGFYPEDETGKLMKEFIKSTNLHDIKPDFRHYGFNHPNGSNSGGPAKDHGYERCVTIPNDLKINPPFVKKHFEGGLFAAHMIPFGAFEEWGWLIQWGFNNERYFPRCGKPTSYNPQDGLLLMEEQLNAYNNFKSQNFDVSKMQLDLLLPIQEKGKPMEPVSFTCL